MGKFRIGDRVRFVSSGYNDRQQKGCKAIVIALDEDGDAIVDSDNKGERIGWTDVHLEVINDLSPETATLRDQFAMAVLTGLLADPNVKPEENEDLGGWHFEVAVAAYALADAMLAERSRVK